MTPPIATVPGWVAPAVLVVLFSVLIFAVIELLKSSRARCAVKEHLIALWYRYELRDQRGSQSDQKRKRRSWLIDFPAKFMAQMLLGIFVIGTAALYGLTFLNGPATFGVKNASFNSSSSTVVETNIAAPHVGEVLPFHATLDLSGGHRPGAVVVVTGPSATVTLGNCYVNAESKTANGYVHGSQARIGLAELGSTDQAKFHCSLSVKHRIRHQEEVTVELAGTELAMEPLYLLPADVELGQEMAEALAEREVHNSPAGWQSSSMHPARGGFKQQGKEWLRLDQRYLHGFHSEPPGLTTTLHHLEDTRIQSAKIVTLEAFIASRPVAEERFKAKGSGRQAIREVYAIGQQSGEQGGWCTTTRSTAQAPLKKGDHLKIRAAVIEWGRSQESGGRAVMLNCPAVKVLGSTGKPARASGVGAATAPGRFDH